ncbi:IclR family transcriptional regulator [Sphaerisporangium krabiense]|uniref:IclR family acetate operon transcriptional repressor n=1 Tax=Sphaerisporangium krabiense TaxID=763782 RepID=A0A7W9DNX6_9ACTN|nr:IclR family transcriptional regulator [Sphaerisporangium krabiense]MBB5625881.1 IclR family acetate operon transcriptional repressor [Sphaerisporangium krabiense]GII64683.1 IclR family transcriptional regulator [Sphaerisporangium krabiense]
MSAYETDEEEAPSAATEGQGVAPVRSVARAVDILLVLGDGPGQLSEISAAAVLSKATTYRILTTLKNKGMVLQAPSGEYRLGPGCFRMMSGLIDLRAGFPFDADADLKALRAATGETITVHVRAGLSRVCIEELPSPQPIRYTAGLGVATGIHVGSAGKVLLAFLPPDELEDVLRTIDLRPMTPSTITDIEVLRQELDSVRRRGTAYSAGERVVGAIGVSAPVLDDRGHPVAALSVLCPASRVNDDRRREFERLVARTGEDISKRIHTR